MAVVIPVHACGVGIDVDAAHVSWFEMQEVAMERPFLERPVDYDCGNDAQIEPGVARQPEVDKGEGHYFDGEKSGRRKPQE